MGLRCHVRVVVLYQIEEIREKAAKLKERILKYQDDQLQAIEVYIGKLMSKVESLEAAQLSTSRFLKENSTTVIVEKRKEKVGKLDKCNKVDSTTGHEVEKIKLVLQGNTCRPAIAWFVS